MRGRGMAALCPGMDWKNIGRTRCTFSLGDAQVSLCLACLPKVANPHRGTEQLLLLRGLTSQLPSFPSPQVGQNCV